MIKFNEAEKKFLEMNEVCRIATVSKNNKPHLVPVCYIFKDGFFYIFTDYGTKKIKNIKENPNVALLVDVYKQPRNKAVLILGKAELLEKGDEYRKVYEIFYKKFDWVRRDPWNEGEAPLIKVIPEEKISWGLRFG